MRCLPALGAVCPAISDRQKGGPGWGRCTVEGTAGTTWPPWRWLDFSSSPSMAPTIALKRLEINVEIVEVYW